MIHNFNFCVKIYNKFQDFLVINVTLFWIDLLLIHFTVHVFFLLSMWSCQHGEKIFKTVSQEVQKEVKKSKTKMGYIIKHWLVFGDLDVLEEEKLTWEKQWVMATP